MLFWEESQSLPEGQEGIYGPRRVNNCQLIWVYQGICTEYKLDNSVWICINSLDRNILAKK